MGIARDGLFQERYSVIVPAGLPGSNERFGAEVCFVGLLVLGAIADQSSARPYPKRRAERGCDGLRNVLLNPEHVGQIALVFLGPDARSIIRSDELRIDADTWS